MKDIVIIEFDYPNASRKNIEMNPPREVIYIYGETRTTQDHTQLNRKTRQKEYICAQRNV